MSLSCSIGTRKCSVKEQSCNIAEHVCIAHTNFSFHVAFSMRITAHSDGHVV